jgi:hypothetical protein
VFWDELRTQKKHILLATRTKEVLSWHMNNALRKQKALIVTASEGDWLIAYAICDQLSHASLRFDYVRFIDFQALNGYEEALPLLVARVLELCRDRSAQALSVVGCWLNRPDLPSIRAPYHRKLGSWTAFYLAKDKHLDSALKDARAWAPSAFDGDTSLL